MTEDERVVGASAEQVVAVVEQMVDLPWPEGDDDLTWEIDGLEGQSMWLMHVLPLASRGGEPAAALATAVATAADRRWGARFRFDATRYTDDASTSPGKYDRRSAPAGLVRSLGAESAPWWRHRGHAVVLVDSTATAPHDDKVAVLVLDQQWMGKPGREEESLHSPLVQDLLSGETGRVMHAVWQVLGTRDPALLGPVATALPAVERATEGLDLGGALASNSGHLARALARVRLFAAGTCLCTAYPDHQMQDPVREQERGHVRIVGTVPNDRQWEDDRICECTACGRRYQVEHGEYHYPWWSWTPQKRRKRA